MRGGGGGLEDRGAGRPGGPGGTWGPGAPERAGGGISKLPVAAGWRCFQIDKQFCAAKRGNKTKFADSLATNNYGLLI